MCQTNPIPGRRDTPPLYYSIIPPCQSDAIVQNEANFEEVSSVKCQVLSQASRASSPRSPATSDSAIGFPNAEFRVLGGPLKLPAEHRLPRAKCAKRTQFARAYRAKQSQFALLWHGARPGSNRAKRSQFPALPGGARPEGRGSWVDCAKRSQFRPEHRRRVGATHASPLRTPAAYGIMPGLRRGRVGANDYSPLGPGQAGVKIEVRATHASPLRNLNPWL